MIICSAVGGQTLQASAIAWKVSLDIAEACVVCCRILRYECGWGIPAMEARLRRNDRAGIFHMHSGVSVCLYNIYICTNFSEHLGISMHFLLCAFVRFYTFADT